MRKAPLLLTATVAGIVGMVGYHSKRVTVSLPGRGAHAGSAARPPAPSPAGDRPPAKAGATTTTAPAGAVRSAVGAAEQYGYGELSVRVTAQGSHISDVAVAQIQVAESYSAQLAQQVVPMLRSEVLTAQSANIQSISGASYTAAAYQASVQSALDKLHVK